MRRTGRIVGVGLAAICMAAMVLPASAAALKFLPLGTVKEATGAPAFFTNGGTGPYFKGCSEEFVMRSETTASATARIGPISITGCQASFGMGSTYVSAPGTWKYNATGLSGTAVSGTLTLGTSPFVIEMPFTGCEIMVAAGSSAAMAATNDTGSPPTGISLNTGSGMLLPYTANTRCAGVTSPGMLKVQNTGPMHVSTLYVSP